MKKLVYAAVMVSALGLETKVWADSNESLNSVEAVKQCETQIQSVYANDEEIRFRARPASSLSQGVYTFWINALASNEEGRESRRYLCEITRYGDLLGLVEEDGRWRQ